VAFKNDTFFRPTPADRGCKPYMNSSIVFDFRNSGKTGFHVVLKFYCYGLSFKNYNDLEKVFAAGETGHLFLW
jgi:hypothetical protein